MDLKRSTLLLVLLAMVLICFAIVAPLTGWLTNPPAITEYFVEGAMMTMVILGTGFVLAVIIITCKRNGNCSLTNEDYTEFNQPRADQKQLKLLSKLKKAQKRVMTYLNRYEKFVTISGNSIGMMMFAKGALILIIWKAIDARYCLGPLQSYEKTLTDERQLQVVYDTILHHQLLIALTAFQVVFIVSQVVIAIFENMRRVVIPTWARYFLKGVLIGNIIMYIYTFLLETEEELHLKSEGSELVGNASLIPDGLEECLDHSMRSSWVTEHKYVDGVSSYLYPLNIEFYLASSVLIVSFISRSETDDGGARPNGQFSITAGEVTRLVFLFFFKEVIMIVGGIVKIFPYLVKQFMTQGSRIRSPMLILRRTALILISTLVTLPTVIQITIVWALEAGFGVIYKSVLIFYILQLASSIATLGAAVIVAVKVWTMMQRGEEHCSDNNPTEEQQKVRVNSQKNMSLRFGDLMMLAATAALLVYHLFPICGIMTIAEPTRRGKALHLNVHGNNTIFNDKSVVELGALGICNDFILGIEILLQTGIILFGLKINSVYSEEAADMMYLSKFLAYSNLQMWIDSSLTQSTMDETNPMAEVVFSRIVWVVISRCITPLMLFYRLHSVHLLNETGFHLFTQSIPEDINNNPEMGQGIEANAEVQTEAHPMAYSKGHAGDSCE